MPRTEFDYEGQQLFITTSTQIQTAFVQQDVAAADQSLRAGSSTASATQVVFSDTPLIFGNQAPNPTVVSAFTVLALQYEEQPEFLVGNAAVPSVQVLLDDNWTYTTGATAASTVVAADGVLPTIINNSASDVLIGVTGAANQAGQGATLEGLAGANLFITGTGGRDAVLLDGAANNLTSNGDDVVLVGGPSTIVAAAGGMDNVTQTTGTTLAFFNESNAGTVNTVTGAAGGIVLMAGPGSASVTAGAGQEFFFLDTSAGNASINANGSTTAALTLIKNLNVGTANILVNNFAPGGTVAVHGYSTFGVTQSSSNPGASVLSLSDGSQVTFSGLSTAALQGAILTV